MNKVKGYYVVASTSERTTGRVKGPFKERGMAEMHCENKGPGAGVGWCGANDGKVEEVEFFYDMRTPPTWEGLYLVMNPVQFVDEEQDYNEQRLISIKSKISKEDWEFIKSLNIDEQKLES